MRYKSTQINKINEQRFVALLHDEIIKSDLVFDQRSNELVGFVEGKEDLATHALVFYVCFIVLRFLVANSEAY
jgi:hypothetical protein